MIRFWVDEFDIDGIRLDCANILDFNFMKEMRAKTASMKPDFWLMGEVIHGDYSRWVNPEMLHSVTNYELHKSILNNDDNEATLNIPVPIQAQTAVDLLNSDNETFENNVLPVQNGRLEIKLKGNWGAVLKIKGEN